MFLPRFKITDCDLERAIWIASFRVNRNAKSGRKTIRIAFDGLIERSRVDVVDAREIGGENHSMATHGRDVAIHGHKFGSQLAPSPLRHNMSLSRRRRDFKITFVILIIDAANARRCDGNERR